MAVLKIDYREAYPRCLWISVFASLLGAFQFGYQVGVLNTSLTFIAKDLHYHKDAVLSSAVVVGAAFGALLAGKLADLLGPRHAQVLNCLPFLLGGIIAAAAQHKHVFLAGRFIAGIGAGAASLYVPRYIAEISPPSLRGWLGSLNQVLINTGILAALCAGIPYESGYQGFNAFGGNLFVSWWRCMIAAGLLPTVLQILVLTTCPESPVWLEQVGRRDAADNACMRLWGAHALLPDPDYEADAARAADLVTSASQQLWPQTSAAAAATSTASLAAPLLHHSTSLYRSQSLQSPRHQSGSFGPAAPQPSQVLGFSAGSSGRYYPAGFRQGGSSSSRPTPTAAEARVHADVKDLEGWESLFARRYRWMMALALGLPLLQQASGINTVVYYSSKIFAAAGLQSAITASIITGGVNLVFTVASAAVLDRYGRKPLLLLSYLGMAASLGAVAGVSVMPSSDTGSGLLMVVLVLLYVAFFATGSGPISWVLLSEILPARIKGHAASLATAVAWIGNLTVTLSFDALFQHLGLGGTYLLYALLNGGAALYVAALLVETRCRTLQEIEESLLLPDVDRPLAALFPVQRPPSVASSTAGMGAGPGVRPSPGYYDAAGFVAAASGGSDDGVSGGVMNTALGFYSHQLSYRPPSVRLPWQQQQQQQQRWGLTPSLAAAAAVGAAEQGYQASAAPAAASPESAAAAAGSAEPDDASISPESLMQLPSAAAAAAALASTSGQGDQQDPQQQQQQQQFDNPACLLHDDSSLPSALPTVLQSGAESSASDLMLSRQEFVTEWARGASADAAAAAMEAELLLTHESATAATAAVDKPEDDAGPGDDDVQGSVVLPRNAPAGEDSALHVLATAASADDDEVSKAETSTAPQQQQQQQQQRVSNVDPEAMMTRSSIECSVTAQQAGAATATGAAAGARSVKEGGMVTITGFVVPGQVKSSNGDQHSSIEGD